MQYQFTYIVRLEETGDTAEITRHDTTYRVKLDGDITPHTDITSLSTAISTAEHLLGLKRTERQNKLKRRLQEWGAQSQNKEK